MNSLLKAFGEQFTIPVIRHTDGEKLEKLSLALAEGGMKILEVTIMSEAAFGVIEKLSKRDDLMIGAGTILNEEQAKRAINAGAKFLVSPGLDEKSVLCAQKLGTPFVPGVLTPSEIMKAIALNLSMVKVFPISSMGGVTYLKNLQGPFPQMKWMTTGGINLEDYGSYANSGATCIGVGGHLTPKDLIQNGDWKALTKIAETHIQAAKQARH